MAVGIDVGGTKCLAVRMEPDGSIVREASAPTPTRLPALEAVLAELLDEVGPVPTVGIGVPVPVDKEGRCGRFPNLPDLDPDGFHERIQRSLGVEIKLANDATCAALAEWRLRARTGVDDLVVVSVGTGIGAGVVLGGQLQWGAAGAIGEVGHLTVQRDGRLCGCGRRGCWETIASGSALDRLAAEALGAGAVGAHLVGAYPEGSPSVTKAVDLYVSDLVLGLSSVVAAFDPAELVLAGGVMRSAEILLPLIEMEIRRSSLGIRERWPSVVATRLGHRAAAIGAALLTC